jgi:hypothetical protein
MNEYKSYLTQCIDLPLNNIYVWVNRPSIGKRWFVVLQIVYNSTCTMSHITKTKLKNTFKALWMVTIIKSSKETWGHNWPSLYYECWTLGNITSYFCFIGDLQFKMPLVWWNVVFHHQNIELSQQRWWSCETWWGSNNIVMDVGILPWELLWMVSQTLKGVSMVK